MITANSVISDSPPTLENRDTTVVFFDGGFRGNPGPGGSGSVIVQIAQGTTHRQLVGTSFLSMARRTTTNNLAEFVELYHVLRRAVEKTYRGIHIVGDSAMILNMLHARKAPRAKTLHHWYRKTRRLADVCMVGSWTHHYRDFNKMAYRLANQAMDSTPGRQDTDLAPEGWDDRYSGLLALADNVLTHWISGRDDIPNTQTTSGLLSEPQNGALRL